MLSHTHLGTCGSGSRIVCHFLFQKSRKTKDEASNATKTQMSLRSQHGARTAIYQELHLGAANYPMTNPTFGQCICTVPAASQDPGPSASRAFARWEREPWHLPKGLPEGSWRGSGMERKKLHYRQTGDNPGNSQKPQHKPRREPGQSTEAYMTSRGPRSRQLPKAGEVDGTHLCTSVSLLATKVEASGWG